MPGGNDRSLPTVPEGLHLTFVEIPSLRDGELVWCYFIRALRTRLMKFSPYGTAIEIHIKKSTEGFLSFGRFFDFDNANSNFVCFWLCKHVEGYIGEVDPERAEAYEEDHTQCQR